jgi:CheY-like chemotaxis protein
MRRFEVSRPDLVTLDITLPEQSGVKCYRLIKENADTADTKVVIITGVQKEFKGFIHSRRQVPPPDGYVAKPFSAEDLIEAVRSALG